MWADPQPGKEARATKGMPTAIICKTVKGKGVSFMENSAGWHLLVDRVRRTYIVNLTVDLQAVVIYDHYQIIHRKIFFARP